MSILPSVILTPPDVPLPSIITLPLPLGNRLILPSDTDTISLPLTSKSPPNCGVVSSDMLFKADDDANPDTKLDLVIFLRANCFVYVRICILQKHQ